MTLVLFHLIEYLFQLFYLISRASLDISKSTGPDGVLISCLLKEVASKARLQIYLTSLYLIPWFLLLESNLIIITPVHKGDDPSNYRPISVFPMLAIILI